MPLNTLWICILWFLQTRKGVLSTKLIPVHLPKSTFLMNRARGIATSRWSSTKRLYETTFGNRWRIMLADQFKIKVFETTITRIMKKNDNHHNFCLWQGRTTVIFPLFEGIERVFCHHCVKKLAEVVCHTEYFYNWFIRHIAWCDNHAVHIASAQSIVHP